MHDSIKDIIEYIQIRQHMIKNSEDSESSIEIIQELYDLLRTVETRLKMLKNQN